MSSWRSLSAARSHADYIAVIITTLCFCRARSEGVHSVTAMCLSCTYTVRSGSVDESSAWRLCWWLLNRWSTACNSFIRTRLSIEFLGLGECFFIFCQTAEHQCSQQRCFLFGGEIPRWIEPLPSRCNMVVSYLGLQVDALWSATFSQAASCDEHECITYDVCLFVSFFQGFSFSEVFSFDLIWTSSVC